MSKLDCGYNAKGFEFAKVWPLHQTAIAHAETLDRRQRAAIERIEDRNPWTTVHDLVTKILAIASVTR